MRVTVVGAGIMGLTTAWALTKRGHEVTLVEQGASIPSPLAASGDQHRMIRRAYGAQGGYAALITEAYDAWDELWADLGASHYVHLPGGGRRGRPVPQGLR
jgi:sarcosine oxidase